MKHQPSPLDLAADLRRCIYATSSKQGFDDPNFKDFFVHALKIFDQVKEKLDPEVLTMLKKQLKKAQNSQLDRQKRRESLLMAVVFLN